jgi:hypothetical protein
MAGLWNQQTDDEPLIDVSVPINGVNNAQPPSAIGPSLAQLAENRLAGLDGLNRPRPGIIRLAQTTGSFASLDSIHHLGTGVFLCSDGPNWYTYDSRSNVLTSITGGPAYTRGTQVYAALSNATLYFTNGTLLSKYLPATGFGTNTLPGEYPSALYPIWAVDRLIYVWQNSLVVSDVLDPEVWDPITQTVTLDPQASDYITGQTLWQVQRIAVFRNGSTYVVETGPGLNVVDWEINRVSGTIGCCCHGTIAQAGMEVYFLSETGRGVYQLSQLPTSEQYGVLNPISAPIKPYIERINWSAIQNARAQVWNDLYLLSVPLDGAAYNNYMLVYSISLATWQGTWCFEDANDNDIGARTFSIDRTNPNQSFLLVATRDGFLSQFTYPPKRQYYDQNIDNTKAPYHSSLTSRAFTFGQSVNPLNQIQPYRSDVQFLESLDPVQITVWADRTIQIAQRTVETTTYLLSLTIPGFPFDLDREGYKVVPISLLGIGLCNEMQLEFDGTGNWTLYQIECAAWESMPLITV